MAELTDDDVFGQSPQPSSQGQELSDDDVFGPTQQASSPATAELSDDDVFGDSQPETSGAGAFLRSTLRGAAPTTAGVATGVAIGSAAGSALDPVLGPAGTIGGGALGFIAGGGIGWLTSKAEDWLADKLGLGDLDSPLNPFSKKYEQADIAQHPIASELGEAAPALLTGRPSGTLIQRGVGALIGGGAETGQEALNGQNLDPWRIGTAAAVGAALPNLNKRGEQIANFGTRQGARFRGTGTGAIQAPVANEGQPGRPDLKQSAIDEQQQAAQGDDADEFEVVTKAGADQANDITTTAPGIAADNPPAPEIAGAGNTVGAPMLQREAAAPSDPTRDYRKNAPASVGGISSQDTTTLSTAPIHEDISAALAPVETGIEQANQAGQRRQVQQATRIPATMEPEEASQLQRQAIQNVKDRNAAQQQGGAFNAQQPQGQLNPDRPAIDQRAITASTQRAMRRPIVETPMPTGANSSRNPNGPVYVDPRVPAPLRRPVAVHETVEQDLMAKGVDADTAHKIATEAEKQEVLRNGGNWEEYTKQWDGLLATIEHEKTPMDPAVANDLHVSVEESIGHHADKNSDVTAAVSPEDQKLIGGVSDELGRQGKNDYKQKFDEMAPDQQLAVAKQLADFLDQQHKVQTKAAGRPKVGDVTARSNVDLQRKQGALDAIKSATDKFLPDKASIIPTSVADKQSLIGRLQQMVDDATKQNGGVEPTEAYKPRVKPPEWQLLRAAQRVLSKPTPKNIRDYVTAEELLRGGGAKDVQDTARIEGDISRTPAAIRNATVAEQPDAGRETFEPIPDLPAGKDNSYVDAQNRVREFVNNLSNMDYSTLSDHFDLHNELDEPADPAELLGQFKQMIAGTTGRRPGVMEAVPAEDVRGKPKRVNPADLAETVPGAAATPGRSLKGTPEFERLAAQYGGATAPDRAGRLEEAETAEREEPVTWQSAGKKFLDMMYDEKASGKEIPLQWMMKKVKDAFSPDADKPTQEYAETLPGEFQRMVNRVKNLQLQLRANVLRAADFKLTPAERKQIYQAQEDGTVSSLPAELQGYVKTIDTPMRDRYNEVMRNLKDLDEKHDLGLDLPNLAQGVGKNFVPRVRAGKQAWDMADETNVDPVTGKTLNNWASTLQDRDFFSLQPVDKSGAPMAGQRLLVKPTADGWSVIRNGALQKIKGAAFEKIGDQVTMGTKKTGPVDYALDHATVREISQNVKDENGATVDYHQNSTLAWAQALDGAQAALERMRLLASIKTNPDFINNSTTDKTEAKKRGYELTTTQLPQFQKRNGRDLFMPDGMRWAMDDFNARGYTGRGWDQANALGAGLIKPMYFFGPLVHALNETDKWTASRGFDWVPGTGGWKSLAKTGYDAIRDVSTQGPVQQMIRENGGNPMYAHQLTRDLVPQFARALGEDILSNPSQWDPVAKIWGVDTKQLARQAYNASSKPMWYWSDVLLTQKVMENMQRYKMSPAYAVADAHQWIDSYIMPTTVGPNNMLGRVVSKTLSTPAVSLFGPYHYGLFHTLANLTRGVMKAPANIYQKGASRETTRPIGQMMALAAMAWGVYPLLDKLAQKVSGNENAEFSRRGITSIPHAFSQVLQKKKDPNTLVPDVFTPSIPLNMAIQASQNRDWHGKSIMERGASLPEQATEGADWALREGIPPLGTLSTGLTKPEATPGSVAGRFLAGQVGVHLSSDAEAKYNEKINKYNETDMKTRHKHPQGAFEELYGMLTR